MGRERGQVLVIVVVGLVVLLGFLALVVDVGLLYLERARCMNVAEAAAIAGVEGLPDHPTRATALALEYVVRNGLVADQATVVLSQDNTQLEVTLRQTVRLFFARLLGFETAPVSGTAAVRVSALRTLQGAAPLGVERQNFEFGAVYYLKNSPGYGGSHQGNFGCLALGGQGARSYEENIATGYGGVLEVGDAVVTEPGDMSGATTGGIGGLIDADPGGTYEHHAPDSPRILMVPVVEWTGEKDGRTTATVVGFAAFWLEGVGGQGNENYVTGRFMRLLTSAGQIGTGGSSGGEYGLYGYQIIK